MTVTTAKEFMQVIAKHYEKCKGIYLHTMYNIPFKLIDGGTATLKGLPEDSEERQGVAIMHAILLRLYLSLVMKKIQLLKIFYRKCMKNSKL